MSSEPKPSGNSNLSRVQFSASEGDDCQRSLLTKAILKNELECRICLETIKSEDPIWSCTLCFNVFHCACVKNWARSSTTRDRTAGPKFDVLCPTCLTAVSKCSLKATCFCGKVSGPIKRTDPNAVPHSCGSTCGRILGKVGICIHLCPLVCHPGSCPPCESTVEISCYCSKAKRVIACHAGEKFSCGSICNKLIPCGRHNCDRQCHSGPCVQSLDCKISCGQQCGRKKPCGIHYCSDLCHSGDCSPCEMDPSVVRTCPCGITPLTFFGADRKVCTDPVPTCDSICRAPLICGPPDKLHLCQRRCHVGPCTCDLTTLERCACGLSSRLTKCVTILGRGGRQVWNCQTECLVQLSCGRHMCRRVCCTDCEHVCRERCGRPLSCGQHSCAAFCHEPPCGQCTFISHAPVRCTCGRTELPPPVPCGQRPICKLPCSRSHDCSHEPDHLCHYEDTCPPCVALTEKRCAGSHMVKKVPCSLLYWNCRTICGKPRESCSHTCQRQCHIGKCLEESEFCGLPCTRPRPSCGHPCAWPCHDSFECPETPCEAEVKATCSCGRIDKKVKCKDISSPSSASASDGQGNQVVLYKCDDECARVRRSRLLAEALGIERSDKPLFPTNYSKFMRSFFAPNSDFVRRVERELCNLVDAADRAQTRRNGEKSHNFPPMNRDRRRFICEYARLFSMEPVSYDSGSQCSVTVYCKTGVGRRPTQLLSDQMKR